MITARGHEVVVGASYYMFHKRVNVVITRRQFSTFFSSPSFSFSPYVSLFLSVTYSFTTTRGVSHVLPTHLRARVKNFARRLNVLTTRAEITFTRIAILIIV